MARKRRSFVDLPPPPIRQELDRRTLAGNYGRDQDLAVWLADLGHKTSTSSVNRYVKRLRAKAESPGTESPSLEDLLRWRDKIVMLKSQVMLLNEDLDRELHRLCSPRTEAMEGGA